MALVVAKEAPQRAELAKGLQTRRRRLTALRNEVLPALRELESELLETCCNNIQFSLPGAGRQMQQELFERLGWLVTRAVSTSSCSISTPMPPTFSTGLSRQAWARTISKTVNWRKRVDKLTGVVERRLTGDVKPGGNAPDHIVPLFICGDTPVALVPTAAGSGWFRSSISRSLPARPHQ